MTVIWVIVENKMLILWRCIQRNVNKTILLMRNLSLLFASAIISVSGAVQAQSAFLSLGERQSTVFVCLSETMGNRNFIKSNRNSIKSKEKFIKSKENFVKSNGNFTKCGKESVRYTTTEETQVFKPAKETVYVYTDEGTWELEGEYSYAYRTDEAGNSYKTMTEVNGDDQVIEETCISADGLQKTVVSKSSSDGGKTFVNSEKKIYTYDHIVTSLVVDAQRYLWSETENDWVVSANSYKREVVRDGDGNVTYLTVAVPYDGAYDIIERYTNTVDPQTKQVETAKFEQLAVNDDYTEYVWKTQQYLTDIKWHRTDGQIVFGYTDWDWIENLVSSAVLSYEDNGVVKSFGDMSVALKDGGRGYSEVINYTDVLGKIVSDYTVADDNGSSVYDMTTYSDLNTDGKITDDEVQDRSVQEVTYDSHGNCVQTKIYESSNGAALEQTQGSKVEITYDVAHGDLPRETLEYRYDSDKADYVPFSKVVVESFADVTNGIGGTMQICNGNGEARIYNIQGTEMGKSALGKGLFIVKKNGKAIKVAR